MNVWNLVNTTKLAYFTGKQLPWGQLMFSSPARLHPRHAEAAGSQRPDISLGAGSQQEPQ